MDEANKKNLSAIRGFILGIVPALLLVSALFYGFGVVYARMLLPVFAIEMELFHPEYEIVAYGTEETRHEGNSIYYTVKIKRAIAGKNGIPLFDKTVKLNTVASVLYIQPIIVFSLLLSWPPFSLRERGLGILISTPLIIGAASLDIPVFFISQIEGAFPTGSLSEQIRVILNNFFSNGGRQFLALLVTIGTAGIIGLTRIQGVNTKTGPNHPCPCGSGRKYKHCCMNR
jgi:hypothetical protein